MVPQYPRLSEGRTPIRAVLALGIVTGVAMLTYFTLIAAESPLAWDFMAYYEAAEAAVAGEPFVGLEPSRGRGEFVYPPIVILGFVPYALVGSWEIAFVVHSLINAVCLAVLAVVILRELDVLGVALTAGDRSLIVAFVLASLYPLVNIGLGQIDPLVALLVAGVFLGLERHHSLTSGGALGIAVIIKLFPAAFGLWLLWLRRWRAIAVAIGTTLVAGLASILVFGTETNQSFVDLILGDRSRLQAYAEGVSPDFFSVTLIRPISNLLRGAPPVTFLIVSVAIVAPILWIVYQRSETRVDRHMAFLATLVGVLIALPSSNLNHLLYLYFPLVVLVFALDPGSPRRWLLAGMVLMLVPLQPGIIAATLEILPLPAGIVESIHLLTDRALSFASIALLAMVLVLIACVKHARDETTNQSPTT